MNESILIGNNLKLGQMLESSSAMQCAYCIICSLENESDASFGPNFIMNIEVSIVTFQIVICVLQFGFCRHNDDQNENCHLSFRPLIPVSLFSQTVI